MQNSLNDTINTMTVDIRLCGNIPRNEMKARFGAPCPTTASTSQAGHLSTACLAETNGSPTHRKITLCDRAALNGIIIQNTDNMRRGVLTEKQQPLAPVLEPPSWAVPAMGETRLEVRSNMDACLPFPLVPLPLTHLVTLSPLFQPVCESLGRQTSVDLTSKKAFRVGRSPNCDVQLMHATSSRRHAMLFHHSNGSCYVVDCGSAYGTFVNGRRIASPATSGVVVPHKVRRGALIRFGGPGAPCFVLKSLPVHLNNIKSDSTLSDEALQVLRNTRMNALGKTNSEAVRSNVSATIYQALVVARKRSFDSLCSRDTVDLDYGDYNDEQQAQCKRLRCSSPPLSPEAPLRLVSPDLPSMSKPRRVTFAVEDTYYYPATITPEESSDEDNNAP